MERLTDVTAQPYFESARSIQNAAKDRLAELPKVLKKKDWATDPLVLETEIQERTILAAEAWSEGVRFALGLSELANGVSLGIGMNAIRINPKNPITRQPANPQPEVALG